MVDRGYIGGYGESSKCGTYVPPCFLPYNGVTRGQISKIIVKTFGWTIYNPSTPSFTDVPSGSEFYTYVETMNQRQIAGGYGDPARCSPYATPCFLPYNSVTRGQMSKMTSNSAGYTDSVANRQSYYDVPSNDAFYTYVERLVMNNSNPPYPFDLDQPACSSTTLPCFYPSLNAPRVDAVTAVYLAQQNQGQTRFGQVLGYRKGKYRNIQSYVVTPASQNPKPANGNQYQSPVGMGDTQNAHFVESGFLYACNTSGTCALSPYSTWSTGKQNDPIHLKYDQSVKLEAGKGYTYRTDYAEDNKWTAFWCNSTTCSALETTEDMGKDYFTLSAVGGEVYPISQTFGTLYFYNTYGLSQISNGGYYWNPWCPDPKQYPTTVRNAKINACDSTGNFTVSY
jgi:hypothetical protein